MKLFLTSQASKVLDQIVPTLGKKPNDLKLLFIPTAGDPYDKKPWMEADHQKLEELGFNIVDFDLKNKTEADVRKALDKTDIIFVAGGNTFYLLEHAKKSGFDKLAKEFAEAGKIYIGSSAGSCIAGPDLEPITLIDEPEKANLDNTKAFGLVDFVVLPHHGREKYDQAHEIVLNKFSDQYKIIPITDDQFVAVNGNTINIMDNL